MPCKSSLSKFQLLKEILNLWRCSQLEPCRPPRRWRRSGGRQPVASRCVWSFWHCQFGCWVPSEDQCWGAKVAFFWEPSLPGAFDTSQQEAWRHLLKKSAGPDLSSGGTCSNSVFVGAATENGCRTGLETDCRQGPKTENCEELVDPCAVAFRIGLRLLEAWEETVGCPENQELWWELCRLPLLGLCLPLLVSEASEPMRVNFAENSEDLAKEWVGAQIGLGELWLGLWPHDFFAEAEVSLEEFPTGGDLLWDALSAVPPVTRREGKCQKSLASLPTTPGFDCFLFFLIAFWLFVCLFDVAWPVHIHCWKPVAEEDAMSKLQEWSAVTTVMMRNIPNKSAALGPKVLKKQHWFCHNKNGQIWKDNNFDHLTWKQKVISSSISRLLPLFKSPSPLKLRGFVPLSSVARYTQRMLLMEALTAQNDPHLALHSALVGLQVQSCGFLGTFDFLYLPIGAADFVEKLKNGWPVARCRDCSESWLCIFEFLRSRVFLDVGFSETGETRFLLICVMYDM